ncbi:MAG: GNAT family N-acetyltransferase [Thermoleophilaceae bacterium]
MPVRQIAPDDKRERKRFVALEYELLGSEPLFVAETESDVDKRLRGSSPFYEEMEHTLFLASNGRDLARCPAFLNRRRQRDKGEDAGFIGYFAAAPDARSEVAAMLEAAGRWLAERGVKRVIAPFNGAAFHGLGTLTDAFDEDPMFPFTWQPPHYPGLLEVTGYRPTYPLWLFDIAFSSERYRTVSRRALEDARCAVRPLERKRWDAELETLRSLFNETFREMWQFHAMTSEEFHEFLDQIKPVLDQRQFLFAEVEGKPVGFCFGLPDWTPLFRSFKGKMGPLQIVRLMLRAKRYSRAGLIAIGVLDSQRGKHIGQTLAATLYRRYEELGLAGALYYPVNDDNLGSRRFAESFGGRGRIVYHAYDKALA